MLTKGCPIANCDPTQVPARRRGNEQAARNVHPSASAAEQPYQLRKMFSQLGRAQCKVGGRNAPLFIALDCFEWDGVFHRDWVVLRLRDCRDYRVCRVCSGATQDALKRAGAEAGRETCAQGARSGSGMIMKGCYSGSPQARQPL